MSYDLQCRRSDLAPYSPGHGRSGISQSQVQRAVAEFERRLNAGESDVEVVVATGFPLLRLIRQLEGIDCGAILVARFDGSHVNETTKAEVIIVKFKDEAHERAVIAIGGQLYIYCSFMDLSIQAGGGQVLLDEEMRIPDCGLKPDGPIPGEVPPVYRLIVEVEFQNRTLTGAHDFCKDYFCFIQLQAGLLLKFYDRGRSRNNSSKTFAAIAILYRWIEGDIIVADAVSFGTEVLAVQAVPVEIAAVVRQLPVPTQEQVVAGNPWNVTDDPFIRIPSGDIFYLGLGQLLPGPGVRNDLIIDIYDILRRVIKTEW